MLTMFFLLCLEKTILFFSSIHVILKIDFKNKMQDQAAIGLKQFRDAQLDFEF